MKTCATIVGTNIGVTVSKKNDPQTVDEILLMLKERDSQFLRLARSVEAIQNQLGRVMDILENLITIEQGGDSE
jgi:acetolactate synthase regulatory subunit